MPTILSGAPYIKAKTGAKIGIGEHIKDVQRIFRPIFNATDLTTDGSDFDHLFRDGERFKIGELSVEIIAHPGSHPRGHQLQDRGRGICRRHVVHAGLRHRARRFSGRRCPPALSLDKAAAGAASRNAPVHVPRLQGARAAMPTPGRRRSGNSGTRMCTSAAAKPKPSSSRCGRLATPRCRRRRFYYLQSRSTSAPARFLRRKTTGCAI